LATVMTFSPCGHYLAFARAHGAGVSSFVQILDRRDGQHTPLRGQIEAIFCLSFSNDGKYLASGGNDRLIEIWPTKNTKEPTQQSPKTLRNHQHRVLSLAFASDSNILASGSYGEIKLWNVEDEICLHTIAHQHGSPSSLVFSGDGESTINCLAATTDGSLIRVSWNSSNHSEFTSDIVVDGATRYLNSVFSHCGSLLATMDLTNKLCVYNIKTKGMSTAQSVTLPAYCVLNTNAGMTFSSDNKTLAVICDTTSSQDDDTVVRLLDVKDLSLQRKLKWKSRGYFPVSLAIDPSSRYLATAFSDGRVRLWSV
jgi:WD40 repeat protein